MINGTNLKIWEGFPDVKGLCFSVYLHLFRCVLLDRQLAISAYRSLPINLQHVHTWSIFSSLNFHSALLDFNISDEGKMISCEILFTIIMLYYIHWFVHPVHRSYLLWYIHKFVCPVQRCYWRHQSKVTGAAIWCSWVTEIFRDADTSKDRSCTRF